MIETLFTQALGLTPPWEVVPVKFSPEQQRIDFHVAPQAGAQYACPACGEADTAVHDRNARSWRHLDFFQYESFLHAEVPRVKCARCGKVSQVKVPWAQPGSRFTLLFEALVVGLAPLMSVAGLARQLRVGDDPLWRILRHHVQNARCHESHAGVELVGVDETAAKRGRKYLSVFFDLTADRLPYAVEGRSREVFGQFARDSVEHGGTPEAIRRVSMDMSAAYQAGAAEQLLQAMVCFDRFHVVALASEALDTVRRAEQKGALELKGCRWGLLEAPARWNDQQWDRMHWLQRSNLKTARAWRLKEALRAIYRTAASPDEAAPLLLRWHSWARRCRLEPFKKLAQTLKKHREGVLNGIHDACHNGKLEAMNRALQETRARARGHHRAECFITMAYLIAGKLTHLPKSPFVMS